PIAGGTTVTINGSSLSGASVTIGGTAATVTATTATSVTFVTPPHAVGGADVTVTNPGGSATIANLFNYISTPTITSVPHSAGSINGGDAVPISGPSMTGVSVVIGGNPPAAILGRTATSVTINTPSHAAGLVDITVTNSIGSATCTGCFNYVPPPTITGL